MKTYSDALSTTTNGLTAYVAESQYDIKQKMAA